MKHLLKTAKSQIFLTKAGLMPDMRERTEKQ